MHFRFSILCGLFTCCLYSQPSLLITEAPFNINQDNAVEITAKLLNSDDSAEECGVRYSLQPTGDQISGHNFQIEQITHIPGQTKQILTFTPSELTNAGSKQMPIGLNYLVVRCTGPDPDVILFSNEFVLQVETGTTPKIISPTVSTHTSYPTFSWSSVAGVAAYHILISDRPIDLSGLESEEEGESSGPLDISALWQAITPGTTIQYGKPDPSGSFSGFSPPPLSPGTLYYMYVFNNYTGSSPANTKFEVFDVSIFSVEISDTAGITRPENIFPENNDTLSNQNFSSIDFSWTDGESQANLYQVFVYAQEVQAESDAKILLPIWQSSTTDTSITLNAEEILSNKKYYYQVFAQNANGVSLAGDTTAFYYTTSQQEVKFKTRAIIEFSNSFDTLNLGDVSITINSLEGNIDIIPIVTLSDGSFDRNLTSGNYEFIFQKDGYVPLTLIKQIGLDTALDSNRVIAHLIKFSSNLSGIAQSIDGIPISGASVTATDNFFQSYQATSNALGQFGVGLPGGEYSLSITHPDYFPSPDTTLTVPDNLTTFAGTIILDKLSTFLLGSITNENGIPLVGAQINVQSTLGETFENLSDNIGEFSIPLRPGSYLVTVSKTGFGYFQDSIQIVASQKLDIRLPSGAFIINGKVSAIIRSSNLVTTSPYSDARITLTEKKTGESQSGISNRTGDFSFSVLQEGDYEIIAHSDDSEPDTLSISINEDSRTFDATLFLRLHARIEGTLEFSPEVPSNLDDLNLNLISLESGSIVKSIHVTNNESGTAYLFKGVPDGLYQISGGMPGYGLLTEPQIEIVDNVWQVGPTLTFFRSDKSLAYRFVDGTFPIKGVVYYLQPYSFFQNSQDTLHNSPYGNYIRNLVPDAKKYIPVESNPFFLDTATASLSEFIINFPFQHDVSRDVSLNDGLQISFTRNITRPDIDSAILVYGFNATMDTAAFSIADSDTQSIKIDPGPTGGELSYFFVIYTDTMRYSNSSLNSNYRLSLESSDELQFIVLNKPASINIAENIPVQITASGYDISGNSLASRIENSGRVTWTASSSDISIDNSDSLTCTLTLRNSSRKKTRKNFVLTIEISLDGVTVSNSIEMTKTEGEINSITITGDNGNNVDLTAGTPLQIFTTGFDTTFSPPKIIEGIITLSVDPDIAGTFEGNTLLFHEDFIGPARILASHVQGENNITTELGAQKDSLLRGVNIGQPLAANREKRFLFHDETIGIIIADSSIRAGSNGSLKLYRRQISNGFTSTKDFELDGSLYEISNPGDINFTVPPQLRFSVTPGQEPENSMVGIFNEANLEWTFQADSLITDSVLESGGNLFLFELSLYEGNYYGLLNRARPLSISDFAITPNPFSPLVLAKRDGNEEYGTRINFQPHSNKSDQVTISVQIYNTKGELVRILEKFKSVAKTNLTYYWDGKTDSGRWARNGRYFVMLLVKETVNQKTRKFLKTVILFK